MAKLFDLTPLEELEILEKGEYHKEGIDYTTQNLGNDLVIIWADINGKRQRNSIAIQPSKMQTRITSYKLSQETLDKSFQIRTSSRLYEDLQHLANIEQLTLAEYVRIVLQEKVDKEKEPQ